MQLSSYPRPKNDTGIGFHYFPDTEHYSREALSQWVPEIRSLGASWLIMRATIDSPVPEFFLRELLHVGVEPIIHLALGPIRASDPEPIKEQLRYYAECDVNYLFCFSQPNTARAWDAADWAKPGLLDQFSEILIPLLEEMLSVGLIPMLPPLSQAGFFWDTAFLAGEIEAIASKGKSYLFDRLVIGFENLTLNRPVSWGRGGRSRWGDGHPYQAQTVGEDCTGFHSFDWYDGVIRSHIGFSLPLIAVRTGAVVGDQTDNRFSKVDEAIHAERSIAMARSLMDGEASDYVFNNAFWLLAAGDDSKLEEAAWFKANGGCLTAVHALRDLPKKTRQERAVSGRPKIASVFHKPIYHYILFGKSEHGFAEEEWQSASRYIRRFKPTCGFSVDEAMNAEYVTVIGGPTEVSPQVERAIRASGCKVERIVGESRRETKRILNEMATEGKRFRAL